MSAPLFDERALSKVYFDRNGLIVAEEAGELLGFVHAGFGPTDDFSAVSTETGTICLLMTAPHPEKDAIAGQLVSRAEAYLREKGARLLYGGAIYPLNPFYLGLYGGSELPGVLASDREFVGALERSGYVDIDQTIISHLDLNRFRPVMDRRQQQVRRAYRLEKTFDAPATRWWDACASSPAEYTRYWLHPRRGGPRCGQLGVWNIEPLSWGWGGHVAGLVQVHVDQPQRRQGLATFLLGETLRTLRAEGYTLVEVQAMQGNVAALGLYRKLGFREVDRGIVFRKQPPGSE